MISGRIYGRSCANAAVDALKSLAMWVFCGIFVFASYSGAGGFDGGLRIEPQGFATVAALIALRVGIAARDATSSRDPRLHWTREVALRGGVLWLSMFFGAFACFIPGVPLAAVLKPLVPELAADLGVGFALAAVQGFLGCIVATMTPAELADISRQPYLDGS